MNAKIIGAAVGAAALALTYLVCARSGVIVAAGNDEPGETLQTKQAYSSLQVQILQLRNKFTCAVSSLSDVHRRSTMRSGFNFWVEPSLIKAEAQLQEYTLSSDVTCLRQASRYLTQAKNDMRFYLAM